MASNIRMVKVSEVTCDAPDVGTHTVYLSVLFGVSCTARPGGQAELDFRGSAGAESEL